jgi:hypothetical protein
MSNTKAQLFTEGGAPLYTSSQAAGMIGIDRASLITFLTRHEALRPGLKIGQDLFWREGEIEAIRQAKAVAKRGRPAKA